MITGFRCQVPRQRRAAAGDGSGGRHPRQIAGCWSRSRKVAAFSVGGRKTKRPLRGKREEKRKLGEVTEERRRAVKGEGPGGGGGRQKDKCAAWSPDEVGPRTGRGREVYGARSQMTGQPGAYRLAAGARRELRREEALQGAGAQPKECGSPPGSLPARCPSRSAWVGVRALDMAPVSQEETEKLGGREEGKARSPAGRGFSGRSTRRMGPGRGAGRPGCRSRQPGDAPLGLRRAGRAAPDRTPTPGWAVPPFGRAARRSAYFLPPQPARLPRSSPALSGTAPAPGTQAAAAGPAAPNMAATTAGPPALSASSRKHRKRLETGGGAPSPPSHRLLVNSGNTRRR